MCVLKLVDNDKTYILIKLLTLMTIFIKIKFNVSILSHYLNYCTALVCTHASITRLLICINIEVNTSQFHNQPTCIGVQMYLYGNGSPSLFVIELEIKIQNGQPFFIEGIFYRPLHCCPIENV